jgi:hypothetical protein
MPISRRKLRAPLSTSSKQDRQWRLLSRRPREVPLQRRLLLLHRQLPLVPHLLPLCGLLQHRGPSPSQGLARPRARAHSLRVETGRQRSVLRTRQGVFDSERATASPTPTSTATAPPTATLRPTRTPEPLRYCFAPLYRRRAERLHIKLWHPNCRVFADITDLPRSATRGYSGARAASQEFPMAIACPSHIPTGPLSSCRRRLRPRTGHTVRYCLSFP